MRLSKNFQVFQRLKKTDSPYIQRVKEGLNEHQETTVNSPGPNSILKLKYTDPICMRLVKYLRVIPGPGSRRK